MAEYPPLPRVPDLTQPAEVCVAWVIAAEHDEMIDFLRGSGVWYWPAAGELTTGDDVYDVTTHDAAACWVCTPPPPPRCTCHYRLHVAHLPYQVNRTTVRRRTVVLASYFTIDPFCLHHGDIAVERHVSVLADEVLDEDERRGY